MIQQYTQEIVKKGFKHLPMEIVALSLMEQYGWTYNEYLDTPQYIIDIAIQKNNIDAKLSHKK